MQTATELTSWKEIASYLGVSVKTAQTWETQRGLPIQRLPGRRGQVWASIAEIDAWKTSSREKPSPEPAAPAPSNRWLLGGACVAALGTKPEGVDVLLFEIEKTHWATGGVLWSDKK